MRMVPQGKRMSSTLSQVDPGEILPFSAMPGPPSLPLLGHLHLLSSKKTALSMDKFQTSLMEQFGDMVRIQVPGKNMVFLYNPDHFHVLSRNEPRIPISPVFDIFDYIRSHKLGNRYTASKGLISNMEDWYETRKAVQKVMMRPNSAMHYVPEVEEIVLELIDKVEAEKDSQGKYELNNELKKFATDAISLMFIGKKLGAMQNSEDGIMMMENIEKMLLKWGDILFLPLWLQKMTPQMSQMSKFIGDAYDIVRKHIDQQISVTHEDDKTVLASLIKQCGRDSVIPTVFAVDALQAGSETTGLQSNFLLYNVAKSPEVQEKLYTEICDTIGPQGSLTEAALAKMNYTKACLTEAMRINPVSLGGMRLIERDTVIGGYQIPKGTEVIRCGYSAGMDTRNFKDPLLFLPERWLRGNKDRHESNAFANIPFGHGARSCIGMRFAKMEMYVLLVKFVQKYKMVNESGEVGNRATITVEPDRPVILSFHNRY